MPQRRERVFIEGYLGGGSTREVLSVRRNCSQDTGKVSKTIDDKKLKCINPKAAQAQKIYESDGLATT